MIKKKGFTLIELMATLSIFLILSVMISAILIQGQRILVSVDNGAKIQNEVRTALLKIQTEAQKADEVIISNKFGVFYGNKWILSDSSNSARELLRVINNEDDNVRVYVEVNDGDKHQLVEFIIDELTNEMVNNSKNVLISNIEGNDANTISLKVEEISDSKGNKINELVTINCSNVINGNKINESDYLISFTNGNENVINIEIGNVSGSDQGNGSTNDNNSSGSYVETAGEEGDESVGFESVVTNSWPNGGEWKINLTNNTGKDIKSWSATIYSNLSITIFGGWGNLESLGNNLFKLYNEENMWKAPIKNGETIEIKGNYQGESELIMKSISFEYSYY